jgi:hypothetical protein
VGHRHQWHRQAHPGGQLGTPEPDRGHHDAGLEHLTGDGAHAGDPAIPIHDLGDLVIAEEACPAVRRACGLRLDRADGERQTICGSVESTEDPVPVQQRVEGQALVGVEQTPFDAP